MDLFDVVRSCCRRWYILIPLLLITAWLSYDKYSSAYPVYYSNTVLGLAPPSSRVERVDAGVPLPRNGLLDAGGAQLIANMTMIGLEQPAVVDRVVASGGLPDYYAKMFPVPSTVPQPPLIMVEITSGNSAAVTRTLGLVITQAEDTVKTLQQQARVPDDQMVSTFVVSPPKPPVAGMPSRAKSTISIFVAGAGFSVLLAVLLDVLLTALKARAQQRRKEQSEPGTGPDSGQSPNGDRPVEATLAAEGTVGRT